MFKMTAMVGKKFRKELQYSQLSIMIVSPLTDPVPRVQQRQISADHDGRVPLWPP